MKWCELTPKLSESTLSSLQQLGFVKTTPVQATCIPLFMSNKDVAAEAVTGSGKTLAFVIPIIECLIHRNEPLKKFEVGAVIVTPTRELAIQIDEVLAHFSKSCEISKILFVGGTSVDGNITSFEENGGNIITATPGRLLDLFSRKSTTFNLQNSVRSLEVLVLDEADRLLDLGFQDSLNTLLSYLPKQRRTGLFSATQKEEVESLIRAGLRNPVRIVVKEKRSNPGCVDKRTPDKLENYYQVCESDEKFSQLVAFLKEKQGEKHILFLSTCACVDYFTKILPNFLKKISIIGIHGKMRKKRNNIFSKFRQQKSGLLICTDVMARGVDVPEVHWVIQYDPPSNASAFVHRCGRTARIGKKGSALAFLLPAEESYVEFVNLNQKAPIEPIEKLKDIPDLLPKLRKLATRDRDIYEKAIRAFVSFVQSYRKHECRLIFRLKDLDIGRLGNGFGLLRLPHMPEIKSKDVKGFIATDIDLDKINYQDKAREKQRQAKLKAERERKEILPNENETKKRAREKSQAEKIKKNKEEKHKKRKRCKEDKKLEKDLEDITEFSREISLMKKLKKGKISKEEFEASVNDDLD